MKLGRVVGNVVSDTKITDYEARKILIVQPIDPAGSPQGETVLAIDIAQAGIDDIVLVLDEGSSARVLLDEPDTMTIRTVIVGIVDKVSRDLD